MRTMVIVVVLPLAQLLVEQVDVVGDSVLVEELVELLIVDPVRSFDLAVQMRCPWTDAHVSNVQGVESPVKVRQKLRAIVGLHDLHRERQPAEWHHGATKPLAIDKSRIPKKFQQFTCVLDDL